jgi:hypothetical protein
VVILPQVSTLKPCIHLSSPLPIRATCPVHLILIDLTTRTILGEQYISLSFSICSFLHSPVTSSFVGPNIHVSPLFSNTVSLLFSLDVSDQVLHPYETTDKIIFLYILIFKFLDSTPVGQYSHLLYINYFNEI